MKKIFYFSVFVIFISFNLVFGGNIIQSKLPPINKIPPPEKCASCHKTQKTYTEFSSSAHKNMKCFDCHLPALVQKKKYNKSKRGFFRLGYHKQNQTWEETIGNEACQRCHSDKKMMDSSMKCWTCHMPENGKDNIVIKKDPGQPLTQNNIKEVKTIPHRSHTFKIHLKD